MALSNIWREPRREITETLLGLGVILLVGIPYLYGDYRLSLVMQAQDRSHAPVSLWMFAMGLVMPVALLASVLVLWFVVAGIHAAGEAVADYLDCWDIHLRPKKRYR